MQHAEVSQRLEAGLVVGAIVDGPAPAAKAVEVPPHRLLHAVRHEVDMDVEEARQAQVAREAGHVAVVCRSRANGDAHPPHATWRGHSGGRRSSQDGRPSFMHPDSDSQLGRYRCATSEAGTGPTLRTDVWYDE